MKKVKDYLFLIVFIVVGIISIFVDVLAGSQCILFNTVNGILFSAIMVIAGFWVTCYLLFFQLYKDRYPLKFIKSKYIPQMKKNISFIAFSIIYGTFIVIRSGGFCENLFFVLESLFTIFVVLINVYNTSKTMMLNTYIDEFCEEISMKLEKKENSVKKEAINDLKYVLDECVVKEEYSVARNIVVKTGTIFNHFLENSIALISKGESKEQIEDSFDRIIDIGIYQLQICKEVNSDLLISDVIGQQVLNIDFCIRTEQYEWFKKYIEKLSDLTFYAQKSGDEKTVEETFEIYRSIFRRLILQKKKDWINYMMKRLYSMTSSLNFLSDNINLKHFASLVTFGLLNCEDEELYAEIYVVFSDFTNMVCRITNGFSDIKVFYTMYFNHIISKRDKELIKQFLDMIIENAQDNGNDIAWVEYKFYCIKEVLEKREELYINVNDYHLKVLVDVIEMKKTYNGYMFLPNYERELLELIPTNEVIKEICHDIEFLLNICIMNNNLKMYYYILKSVAECMSKTKGQKKNVHIALFDVFVWLIVRTKKINNKQFGELAFKELEDIIRELDKTNDISSDFADKIIKDLSDLARHVNSDNYEVVLHVIAMFADFLKENEELRFINNYHERKRNLYRGLFNIATTCIENDFEEGLRRCSNTMGWFIIYSIKNGNSKLTVYLIQLAKGMLDMSIDMEVSAKTKIFIMTLFTTVGMYCYKKNAGLAYVNNVLTAIERVDSNIVYTAIRLRTYENDMWDSLFEKDTKRLKTLFKNRYVEHQKKLGIEE